MGDEENKNKKTENKLSAYDVAVIAKHLLEDFPEVTKTPPSPMQNLLEFNWRVATICWKTCPTIELGWMV